ncbi:MAG: HAD family hydrolase [Spirochaetes bacterium]|nr:HAD family hydrolase [Spirochaetota bacterium]
MKDYQCYLFDADGTLMDTMDLIYQCFKNTTQHYVNKVFDRATVLSYVGLPFLEQLEKLIGKQSDQKAEEILKFHKEYQLSIYQNYLKLYPYVKDTLIELKNKNKKLGVISSREHRTLDLFLKQFDIFHLFDIVLSPSDCARPKPHPDPVLLALQKLSIYPTEALFVGDAVFDLDCGKAAGVDTALVSWSHLILDELNNPPTWLLKNFHQLITLE